VCKVPLSWQAGGGVSTTDHVESPPSELAACDLPAPDCHSSFCMRLRAHGSPIMKCCRHALYVSTPIKTRFFKYSSPCVSSSNFGTKHTNQVKQKESMYQINKKKLDQKNVVSKKLKLNHECKKKETGTLKERVHKRKDWW